MNLINFLHRINWGFVLLISLITFIGIILLYSIAGGSWDPWALTQLIRVIIGLIILVLISVINIKFWYKLANPFYLICLK